NYASYIVTILPLVVLAFVIYFLFARQMKGVGSSAMNFGKSPAKLLTKESIKVTFKDVAGAEEAKEELSEVVDFLKDPGKFTALGARIPKGVLLIGPPGTGKTLVAKAVAGEADRPFFSISGSDFVEMFVGVGASRVRDLFDQGKKSAPCIIFVDEIDAVGRQRGAGIGGGHDEREQTLNQLLVEMDGFDTREGVILMAATNRPDILDKALLRPGRFDRTVVLDLPDVKGRYEILKVHARRIKIDPSVELMDVAKVTPGASGADLENILNESALLAARKGRKAVTSQEVREACDKVRFGKERRSLDMDKQEKLSTAFHEAGHAMVGLCVEHADPVDKVTIIPRGMSLGATHFMPKKNRLGYWKKEVLDQLAIAMGGRAAEEIFLKDLSSGAQMDITQATRLARAMVCEWGMSELLGTVTYDEREEAGKYIGLAGFHEKNYSEETAEKIDQEVFKLVDEAHKTATQIISEHQEHVKQIADMLMEFETLEGEDIKQIMAGTWDIGKKRSRLKAADELQIKTPPPPPEKKNKPLEGSLDSPQST
ncbi:MAG: ATP-dependent zinc metalloprotease FtsH, partial [Parachlamydiales bacterium]